MQHGREFSPGYKSWTGIDNRAIDNFYEQAEQVSGKLDTQQLSEPQTEQPIRLFASQDSVSQE